MLLSGDYILEKGENMSCLTIYQDNYTDATVISNRFIDDYMKDANDAQLKIYLYMIRMMNAHQPLSISGLADQFNHTEKDVMRALKYWEKCGILSLEYDSARSLSGIHLFDLNEKSRLAAEDLAYEPVQEPAPLETTSRKAVSKGSEAARKQTAGESAPSEAQEPVSGSTAAKTVLSPASETFEAADTQNQAAEETAAAQSPVSSGAVVSRGEKKAAASVQTADASQKETGQAAAVSEQFSKPFYSLDQLKAFQQKDSTAQLLFIAEQYLGRPLSPSDMKSILFFVDRLHFSDDLVDYLLQYCIERGKKDFRYIEKVAISWAQEGISTPKEAETHAGRYDRSVYTVMNALGKSASPTRREVTYIKHWCDQLAFEMDVILEACERTVLATDRHRFEYADKILEAWKEAGVCHKADIVRLDESRKKEKPAKQAFKTGADQYNRFMHNSYDFDALEKELLRN